MKKNMIISAVLLFFVLIHIPNFAFAAEKKEITVTDRAYETDICYDGFHFDKYLKNENGIFYLKDVAYSVINKTEQTETSDVIYKETIKYLYAKNVDAEQQKEIEVNGETVTVYLDNIVYEYVGQEERRLNVNHVVTYSYRSSKPDPDQTKVVDYTDDESGETVIATLNLIQLEKVDGYGWYETFEIPIKVENVKQSGYLLDGILIPYDPTSPVFESYEPTYLASVGLNTKSYRITSSEWTSEVYTQDGITMQDGVLYGEIYVAQYKAFYQGTIILPDAPIYNAYVYYIGSYERGIGEYNYVIQASATYVPINWFILGGGAAVTGTIVIIIYFMFLKRWLKLEIIYYDSENEKAELYKKIRPKKADLYYFVDMNLILPSNHKNLQAARYEGRPKKTRDELRFFYQDDTIEIIDLKDVTELKGCIDYRTEENDRVTA